MSTTEKCSLLVVDDEPYILTTLAALLAPDFQVFTADSGEKARDIFAQQSIDLILKCWSATEPFDYDGEFFHGRDIRVVPKSGDYGDIYGIDLCQTSTVAIGGGPGSFIYQSQ